MSDAFIDAVRKRLRAEEGVNLDDDPSLQGRRHRSEQGNGKSKRSRTGKPIVNLCDVGAPSSDDSPSTIELQPCTISAAPVPLTDSVLTITSKQKRTKSPSDTEKRGARYRPHPSKAVLERYTRSLRHRLFLIDRIRPERSGDNNVGTELDQVTRNYQENFAVMGVNGNLYKCTISTKPSCNCPDFTKRDGGPSHGPCKHLIFIFIRVLKLKEDDPAWWQVRLLPDEVSQILDAAPKSVSVEVLADESVRRQYQILSGSQDNNDTSNISNRKPVEGDCSICFEDLGLADVSRPDDVTTFCGTCGNNFHKTCVQNWARAKGKPICPLCRTDMSKDNLPLHCTQDNYANLATYSSQHARQLTLGELYADTHRYIRRSSQDRRA